MKIGAELLRSVTKILVAPKLSFFMCEQKLYPILRAIRSSVNTQKSTFIAV